MLATSIAPAEPGGRDLVEAAPSAPVTALWQRARTGIAELSSTRVPAGTVAVQAGCIEIVSPLPTWYHGSPTIALRRAVLRASSGSRPSQLRATLVFGRVVRPRLLAALSNASRDRIRHTIISVSPRRPAGRRHRASSAARSRRCVEYGRIFADRRTIATTRRSHAARARRLAGRPCVCAVSSFIITRAVVERAGMSSPMIPPSAAAAWRSTPSGCR